MSNHDSAKLRLPDSTTSLRPLFPDLLPGAAASTGAVIPLPSRAMGGLAAGTNSFTVQAVSPYTLDG